MNDYQTTGPPSPPLTPEQEAKREEHRAMFAELYRRLERPSEAKPRTQAQDQAWRQRANTRRRLRDLRDRLDTLAAKLETMHTEGVGPWGREGETPLCADLWNGRARAPGVAERMDRVRLEAAEGCELSADFLREVEPLFLLCQELRQEAPPVRTPEQERARSLANLSPQVRQRLADAKRRGWRGFDYVDDEATAEHDQFDA